MLKGLFNFQPTSEVTLGFTASERLLYLGKHPQDQNWLRASNSLGWVGYVPVNFVGIEHIHDSDVLLNFLDAAMQGSEARGDVTVTEFARLRDRLLAPSKNLMDQIIQIEDEIRRTRLAALAVLETANAVGSVTARESSDDEKESPRRRGSSPSHSSIPSSVSHYGAAFNGDVVQQRPLTPVGEYACEMIDVVRNAAGISHEKAQIAVRTVIDMLQRKFGGLPDSLVVSLEEPSAISRCPAVIERSPDARRLRELFDLLTACKEDEQQRSWATHEDEGIIRTTILELNEILGGCDHSVSKFVMRESHYSNVQSMALFYQMETRKEIRASLIETFLTICKIDPTAIRTLSNSILPMELAREFKEVKDEARLLPMTRLLTLLMSPGESLPISHYDLLGSDFIVTVLKTIAAQEDPDAELPNELTKFILAYNLQFNEPMHNLTVLAFSDLPTVHSIFSQYIINFLNWGQDPVSTLPHKFRLDHCRQPNSVFKILSDMLSSKIVAKLFYLNDLKVLIDVIIRWLTDLGPGDADENRKVYLTLVSYILRNTSYLEMEHRRESLSECLTRILQEDDHRSLPCQDVINSIFLEFPILKKKGDHIPSGASGHSSVKKIKSAAPDMALNKYVEEIGDTRVNP